MLAVKELLKELIKIPSVNPGYSSARRQDTGEQKIADYLYEYLGKYDLTLCLQPIEPGRSNLIASYKGCTKKAICFCAHLDTVPAENMTIEPFAAFEKDGKIQGRGSADTKASLAAMLTASLLEIEAGDNACPSLVLLFTCDEEAGFKGIKHFIKHNKIPIYGAVIGEPTERKIIISHKGVLRTKITTRGLAAHAATPENGKNAIGIMSEVIFRLEKLGKELAQRKVHPLLGHATLNIGCIQGGTAVNSVPDKCNIKLDRRLLPEENSTEIMKEITNCLHDITEVEVSKPFMNIPGFQISENHPWANLVAKALNINEFTAAPYATDAALLHSQEIPCLIYGPESPAQAHRSDESVRESELLQAVCDYRKILKAAAGELSKVL